MTDLRTNVAALVLAVASLLPGAASAQDDRALPPGNAPAAADQSTDEPRALERRGPVVRVGQGYALDASNVVREIVVVAGDVAVDGRVERDVVVVLGDARISSTAVIGGSLVVVGGGAVIAPGARVGRDLVVVGGTLDTPAEFAPGGEHVLVGAPVIGPTFRAVAPWISRGLLWGRPIVPDLGWIWIVIGIAFLVYAALNVVFDRPVRACAETLSERPLTAFLAGLLVLLFVGPVSLLLVMSVVGVFVVPFLYCAILLAGIVGRIGVARRVGMSVVREDADGNRLQALRSFAIGFAAVVVIYMIPALGFVAWALIGVFGLGAATLALVAGYRQEHPVQAPALPSSNTTPNAPPEPLRDVATAAAPLLEDSGPVDLASFPRASFGRRLSAFLLDVVLVAIVAHLVGPFGDSRNHAFLLLLLAYHIGFWAWKSTTVGGIICQLRITRVHGQPLRFGDAVVRGLSSIFSLVVVGLGCLWILKDAERQAWHDRIAGTYVVIVPRHWPV